MVVHPGKVLLKIVVNRLGDFCEETGILARGTVRFRAQRSTTDMMLVVCRLQELGGASITSLKISSIDLAKAYDSIDRVLLMNMGSTYPFWSSTMVCGLAYGCIMETSLSA